MFALILDGRVSSSPAFILGFGAFVLVANWIERRRNPMPPPGRYLRKPGDIPIIAFWNIFDSQKWTNEGIRFHKRRLLMIPFALAALLGWYVILDAIW